MPITPMRRYLQHLVCAVAFLVGGYMVLPASAQMRIDGIGRGITKVGTLLFSDGSATAPSIAFTNDQNTGFYIASGDPERVSFASNGTKMFSWGTNFFRLEAAAATIEFGAGADLALGRGAAGLLNITDADATPDLNLNVSGAPTPSSCGDGAVATGSSNTAGRVTSTDATACTLTFSASFGGNSADCVISNLIANRGFVSAASSTAFTVSSLTAGDDFMYWCAGR